jgi:hypothetical protein
VIKCPSHVTVIAVTRGVDSVGPVKPNASGFDTQNGPQNNELPRMRAVRNVGVSERQQCGVSHNG